MVPCKYSKMSFTLKPYQQVGVEWMVSMERQTSGPTGGFLCDEMGLGKSVQIIATILKNPKKHTLIVVCYIEMSSLHHIHRCIAKRVDFTWLCGIG